MSLIGLIQEDQGCEPKKNSEPGQVCGSLMSWQAFKWLVGFLGQISLHREMHLEMVTLKATYKFQRE